MWVQDKFLEFTSCGRKGELSSLTLPKDIKDSSKLHNLKIKGKSIDFVKGKSLYIISDEVGFCDDVEYSLFFTDDFMVIDVKKGRIYVKDKEDTIYSIDSKGKIGKYTSNPEKIIWKEKNEILEYTLYFVGVKYNLDSIAEKKAYVENLCFVLKSSYYLSDNKLFTIQPIKYVEDLGGKFKFIIKEKKEVIVPVSLDYEVDGEESLGKSNKAKNKKYNLDDYDADIDDELDDYGETLANLHEIDIFKEYVPDTY